MTPAEKRAWLRIVVAYEDRYRKPLWAGREGTKEEQLDELVAEGLLIRTPDEHRLRAWYSTTFAGRAMAELR